MLGPRFHRREPALGIPRGVLSFHLLAWASFKTKYFQWFFFFFLFFQNLGAHISSWQHCGFIH